MPIAFPRRSRLALAALLAAALLAGGATLNRPGPARAAEAREEPRLLSVDGQATARVTPDTAEARLGVRTEAPTAREAMRRNAAAVASLRERMKQAGVKDEDLRTESWNISPLFKHGREPDGQPPQVVGYVAHTLLSVRSADVNGIGALIDAGFEAGANVAEGVRFFVRDQEAVEDALLQDAVRGARAKADLLARALGVRIVGVHRVNVQGPVIIPVRALGDVSPRAAAPAPAFLPPGQSEITRTVRIDYLIAN